MSCVRPDDLKRDAQRYGIPLVLVGGVVGALVSPVLIWLAAIVSFFLIFAIDYYYRQGSIRFDTAQKTVHALIGVEFAAWVAWFVERFIL